MQAAAVHTFPESFTPEKQRELYQEIIRLYELADNVLAAVQREGITNRELQLELVTPFVTQLMGSANIISAFYVEVVRKGTPVTPEIKDTVKSAFQNFFIALREIVWAMEDKLVPQDGNT